MTDWILVAILVVVTLNYALVRIPGWEKRGVPYWAVQAVNVGLAAYLVVVGIPELPRIADGFLALLFVYYVIQNEMRARGTPGPNGEDAQTARRRAYEDAIEAGRADARDEINRP
jgi:hypothetical protein